MTKPSRLVMVTWLDSKQAVGSWQWLSEYEKAAPIEVVSVGWLIQDDDVAKVLAQSLASDGDDCQAAGRKVIPACCVKRIDDLVEAVPRMKEAAE